jgi:hypothetical protein
MCLFTWLLTHNYSQLFIRWQWMIIIKNFRKIRIRNYILYYLLDYLGNKLLTIL